MPGTPILNKLLADIAAAGGINALIERIAGGDTVTGLAAEFGVSRPFMSAQLNRTPQNKQDMQDALRQRAGKYAEDAIGIADGVASDPNEINKAKLKIETRKWLAGVHDPEQYGAKGTAVNISIGSLHLDALRQLSAQDAISSPDIIEGVGVPIDDSDDDTTPTGTP